MRWGEKVVVGNVFYYCVVCVCLRWMAIGESAISLCEVEVKLKSVELTRHSGVQREAPRRRSTLRERLVCVSRLMDDASRVDFRFCCGI